MAETDLWFGTLSATVRVEDLPASRQVVAIERQANGDWRVCGQAMSNSEGIATLPITGLPTSRIYAIAIDEWGKPFAPGMTVAYGDVIRPTQFLGWMYQVTSPGVLPGEEPEWWNSMAGIPQPVGTAMMQAVRHYQPVAHGPVSDIEWEDGLPWTPADLSVPPELWVDDEAPMSFVSGAVSAWENRGTLGGVFTQPIASARPVLVEDAISGRHAVRFDGVNDTLYAEDGGVTNIFRAVSTAWVLSVYCKRGADPSPISRSLFVARTNAGLHRFSVSAGGAQGDAHNRPSTGGRRLDSDSYAGVDGTVRRHGTWNLVMGVGEYSDRRLRLFVDGGLDSQDLSWHAAGTTSNTASMAVFLASNTIGGTTGCGDVDIALVLAGSSPLSSGDIDRLHGWAAHRYGLTDNLPDGHPYKSEPPKITG